MSETGSQRESREAQSPGRNYWPLVRRALFMLLFVVLYSVLELVLAATAIVQLGFALFTGDPHPRLKRFGAQIARYLYQVVQYWTFNTEEKPFPFSDWPAN